MSGGHNTFKLVCLPGLLTWGTPPPNVLYPSISKIYKAVLSFSFDIPNSLSTPTPTSIIPFSSTCFLRKSAVCLACFILLSDCSFNKERTDESFL